MLLLVTAVLAATPGVHVQSFDVEQLHRLSLQAELQPEEPNPLEIELDPDPSPAPPFSRLTSLSLSAGTLLLGGALLSAYGLGAFNRMPSTVAPSLAGVGGGLVLFGPSLPYLLTEQPRAFWLSSALRVGAVATVLLLTAATTVFMPYSSSLGLIVFTGGMVSLAGLFAWDLHQAWEAPRRWSERPASRTREPD